MQGSDGKGSGFGCLVSRWRGQVADLVPHSGETPSPRRPTRVSSVLRLGGLPSRNTVCFVSSVRF
ncbi:hypothetical protein Lesp02_58990 [Lentzea sp. NBRC 105346]|uniref:hypothetical protein n=1 Tax=Lentzea sp. NBRC 105346 TaxID=3032205 RepID=UPI0024A5B9BB|nr:hypothetical protein [Lentzea sp. NBRC 105346]GLZ33711.1 hypothetical protein Lesp02_58990 [Lentzea sp. NBRC 105346]